jgi:hypothetical protein
MLLSDEGVAVAGEICSLILSGLVIQMRWEENYGDKQGGQVLGQFAKALQTIRQGEWWLCCLLFLCKVLLGFRRWLVDIG